MFESYKENQAALLSDEARTAWGLAAAQGVGLVTIGGMIGNLDDPNFAIAAMKVPLLLSALGLAFAVWAAQRHAVLRAFQLRTDVLMHKRDFLIEQAGKAPTDPFAPLDLSGAKHVFGDENAAIHAYISSVFDGIAADKKREAETDAAWKETEAERAEITKEVFKERSLFIRLQSIAIGLAFAAAVALGFAASTGIQPKKEAARPVAAAEPPELKSLPHSKAPAAPPAPSPRPEAAETPRKIKEEQRNAQSAQSDAAPAAPKGAIH